jgi:hypothetical protein
MSEELRFHIDQYAGDLVRGGMPSDEAMRRARLEFGNIDNVKDDCREARGLSIFDVLQRDTRHAVRLLRRSPGFTFTALATLALCLGANLTIFAVVDSVLLRPLPFPDAARLMSVFNSYPRANVPNDAASLTNYYERRGRIAAFSHVAAWRDGTSIVGETGATERIPTTRVSPEFFETLGMPPIIGRGFTEAETAYGTDRVAVLTDAFWRQRLNADPNVLGRSLRVNGGSITIVGVLPPEFRFLSSRARVYFPLASNPDERSPKERHSGNSDMIARLAPGVSVSAAQAEIDAHNTALERDNPEGKAMAEAGFRSIVVPLHADHVAAVRPVLLLVQAGALVLLTIGAVNLVNLLLIRASARRRERAVRQALGATRGRIVAEVLIETLVLTLTGGLLGLLVGAAGVRLLAMIGAEHLPLLELHPCEAVKSNVQGTENLVRAAGAARATGAARLGERHALLLRALLHLGAVLVAELGALLRRLGAAHLVHVRLALFRGHEFVAVHLRGAGFAGGRAALCQSGCGRGRDERKACGGDQGLLEHALLQFGS